MEKSNKRIPFPQANNFNKIYDLICLDDELKLQDRKYLKHYLNLGTERQISYYLSACEFLGIITHNKEYSELGKQIRNANFDLKIIILSKTIISLPVFGEVFFMNYLYNEKFNNETISQLISVIYGIDNYEVCKRRASTVEKWLQWINENKQL